MECALCTAYWYSSLVVAKFLACNRTSPNLAVHRGCSLKRCLVFPSESRPCTSGGSSILMMCLHTSSCCSKMSICLIVIGGATSGIGSAEEYATHGEAGVAVQRAVLVVLLLTGMNNTKAEEDARHEAAVTSRVTRCKRWWLGIYPRLKVHLPSLFHVNINIY